MCRLFGLHTGRMVATAEFWLVEAADSLIAQSTTNTDGFGIGTFGEDGSPNVQKRPLPAWDTPSFTKEAHRLRGTTFVAHVRHSTKGGKTMANTHPFLQHDRLFAHNGDIGGMSELDAQLVSRGGSGLVMGETDSERIFALITAETRQHGGNVRDGIVAAVSWLDDNVPITSLNFVLTTPTDLWALRYPATDSLYLLERPAGGVGPELRKFTARGSHLHAKSDELLDYPSVVIASERMDDETNWQPIESGDLVHVDTTLTVRTESVLAGSASSWKPTA
ncbi:hypothetical protein B7R21_18700 [Subtercola boreus]|uniref:Glutamine amidotransferase type-2 domain-containing protein n=1 Tax=Subtercola boreus TaxID=120213 RepID=A0A3E0VA37_9MICO|nr:class II glutamine amidotransferase [Subtercola boreus]RFA06692.1 hypothetical protein B7R21_18700 [Subtercola boreus]